MRPQWFSTDDTVSLEAGECPPIPFSKMWEDDIYWFPLLLERKFFIGRADLVRRDDQFIIHKWWFGTD